MTEEELVKQATTYLTYRYIEKASEVQQRLQELRTLFETEPLKFIRGFKRNETSVVTGYYYAGKDQDVIAKMEETAVAAYFKYALDNAKAIRKGDALEALKGNYARKEIRKLKKLREQLRVALEDEEAERQGLKLDEPDLD